MNLISRGAEANIYKENDTVLKERIKKSYRLPEIDEKLRTERTRHEEKLLIAAGCAGVFVPKVVKKEKYSLTLEFISGKRLKDSFEGENKTALAEKIGKSVALLHKSDIIHGDLTTSNMIMHNGNIYLVDFGLGFFSKSYEDKACDLHLFEEALVSTHGDGAKDFFEKFLQVYEKNYSDSAGVATRLEKIRASGRYAARPFL